MAEPRTLRIVIEVDDEGGPNDYDAIMGGLMAIGAAIMEETEV
jgi:hypothetical protein